MKLIALDLDGTTLNSQKEISEANRKAIKKAIELGHIVMALSGRSVSRIQSVLDQYGLDCPIGASNGTAIYVDGELKELISLTAKQKKAIILELEKENVPYNVTTNRGTYAPKDWEERLNKVLSSGRVPEHYYDNSHFKMFTTPPQQYGHSIFEKVEEILENDLYEVQKILILGLDPEQKERLRYYLHSIDDLNIASSSPFNLEVMHVKGHKGYGLKTMAQRFQIPMENTIAIGDENNDIPMFQAAGLAIAMGNAEEEVKAHSDVVTLTNDEDGVAHALEKYVLNVEESKKTCTSEV